MIAISSRYFSAAAALRSCANVNDASASTAAAKMVVVYRVLSMFFASLPIPQSQRSDPLRTRMSDAPRRPDRFGPQAVGLVVVQKFVLRDVVLHLPLEVEG